ncbi:uncharacterized protein LOC112087567 isoform X1 [Eutrema salsugineum]|uniref:uncharacterized protein LOC112087567 isoform X1 n=1 Tax=Eutrema salsugineum TaxID=72664 RepID=UPI000CED11F5|nr:uncharacterized protein LOC112087567 isoform X1 [Eutrema salsugineum]
MMSHATSTFHVMNKVQKLTYSGRAEYRMRSQNIPKNQRLSYALDSLVGEATTWWEQEEVVANYNNSTITWDNLKQRKYREFAQKSHNRSYIPKRLMFQTATKRCMSTPKPQPVPKSKKSCFSEPKKVSQGTLEKKTEVKIPVGETEIKPDTKKPDAAQTQGTKPKCQPQVNTEQCKPSKLSKTICYRCHQRGRFAKTCPARNSETTSPTEPDIEETREVVELYSEISNSSIKHLHLPKVDISGLEHELELTVKAVDHKALNKKDEVATSFITIQEEPPDYKLNSKSMATKETELNDSSDQELTRSHKKSYSKKSV